MEGPNVGEQIKRNKKYVFVTVGTTKFEELIQIVDTDECHQCLIELGYNGLLIQIGKGEFEPTVVSRNRNRMACEYYRFKDSLDDDMSEASLIISHAGAGTVMGALGLRRRLVVVVNERLMGNHQTELADALRARGHLAACLTSSLIDTLKESHSQEMVPYDEPDLNLFPALINEEMGFIYSNK